MPSHIIKPKPAEDFYVRYSTIVDSPCEYGTRAEWIQEDTDVARLERADEHGTSALYGDPPAFGWHDTTITVREGVKDPTKPDEAWYGAMRAFCETLGDDGYFHPPAGMVTWTGPCNRGPCCLEGGHEGACVQ